MRNDRCRCCKRTLTIWPSRTIKATIARFYLIFFFFKFIYWHFSIFFYLIFIWFCRWFTAVIVLWNTLWLPVTSNWSKPNVWHCSRDIKKLKKWPSMQLNPLFFLHFFFLQNELRLVIVFWLGYSDILRNDSTNADALLVRGLCFYYQDNVEKAFMHFTQVLRLAPDHVKARDIYRVRFSFIWLLLLLLLL